MKLRAPAKINLFLHVLGQRRDGYHELHTAFQFLDLCDLITVEVNKTGRIGRSSLLPGVTEKDDLTVRAARLLAEHSTCRLGADIQIEKRIPMGSGLGGGSSDAATVLVALNRLWGLGLHASKLADIGLSVGADVPVFVLGQAAWATGVGEQLRPEEFPEQWIVILYPGCPVSTEEVFSSPNLTRDSSAITMCDLRAGRVRNDCESVVFGQYPRVAAAFKWLSSYGPARMTGTGSAIYLPVANENSARKIAHSVPEAMDCFVARTRNSSPLYGES